ncbi:hypothetical protein B0O99DRAFT_608841 [Bisporella sp. PMI_857]|nr:hypothetical protein B0O99DRAFT_608841 [Bisporella sp. PMI_857]
MASKVIRVTQFKIPSKENQSKIIELYKTLSKSANKNGKPYILSLEAGPAFEDARSQGYTFVSKSEFASLEDMKYYDNECEAHQAFKAQAKKESIFEGVMTTYFEVAVSTAL